jgi:hypothetical protein
MSTEKIHQNERVEDYINRVRRTNEDLISSDFVNQKTIILTILSGLRHDPSWERIVRAQVEQVITEEYLDIDGLIQILIAEEERRQWTLRLKEFFELGREESEIIPAFGTYGRIGFLKGWAWNGICSFDCLIGSTHSGMDWQRPKIRFAFDEGWQFWALFSSQVVVDSLMS